MLSPKILSSLSTFHVFSSDILSFTKLSSQSSRTVSLCACAITSLTASATALRAFAEFAGEIAEYPLEEAVDGAYVEIAVVVQYL